MLFALLVASGATAADLVFENVSNQTVDGGSYEHLVIRNSSGITVRNASFATTTGAVVVIDGSSNVTIEDSDIRGLGQACTGVRIFGGSTNVDLHRNQIHDIADDGMEIHGASGLSIVGNSIYELLGIGTTTNPSGPCFNGHSDGIELFAVSDSVFEDNLIFDVRSTAAFFFGNWATSPSQYCRNLRFANNVFLTPESGFVGYVIDAVDVEFVNNVFWRGIYGGLTLGNNVTGLDVTNNVLHSINYAHGNIPYDPAEHRYRYNQIAVTAGQGTPPVIGVDGNFVDPDPEFDGIPAIDGFGPASLYRQGAGPELTIEVEDFVPAASSPVVDAGDDTVAPLADIRGTPRPQGAASELGAVEYLPEPDQLLQLAAGLAALALVSRRRVEKRWGSAWASPGTLRRQMLRSPRRAASFRSARGL